MIRWSSRGPVGCSLEALQVTLKIACETCHSLQHPPPRLHPLPHPAAWRPRLAGARCGPSSGSSSLPQRLVSKVAPGHHKTCPCRFWQPRPHETLETAKNHKGQSARPSHPHPPTNKLLWKSPSTRQSSRKRPSSWVRCLLTESDCWHPLQSAQSPRHHSRLSRNNPRTS